MVTTTDKECPPILLYGSFDKVHYYFCTWIRERKKWLVIIEPVHSEGRNFVL